jgi:hypothetical protein
MRAQLGRGAECGNRLPPPKMERRARNQGNTVIRQANRLDSIVVLNLLVGQNIGVTTTLAREDAVTLQFEDPLLARPPLQREGQYHGPQRAPVGPLVTAGERRQRPLYRRPHAIHTPTGRSP